jgi:hypothetical protein
MKRRSSFGNIGATLLGTALAMGVGGTAAADSGAQMAANLAALRNEVEELAAEVEGRKETMRGELRSYAAQKADLEMERQRVEMTIKQLRAAKEKRAEATALEGRRDVVLKPAVLEAIGYVKRRILQGLPFKQDERAAELDRLIRQMDEGLLRAPDVVARLWDRVEDELRLASENGIYSQVITVGEEELLVDVARVGMVMMFWKARDGRIGKTEREGATWSYGIVGSKRGQEQVLELFDAFKKQIRTGFFVLPNALPEGGE